VINYKLMLVARIIGSPRRIGGIMSCPSLFDAGDGLLQTLTRFHEELGIEAPKAKKLRKELAKELDFAPLTGSASEASLYE
jgi:hypothetical protein